MKFREIKKGKKIEIVLNIHVYRKLTSIFPSKATVVKIKMEVEMPQRFH